MTKDKKKLTDKTISILIIVFYAALYIFITCFHEPWFDEAQAWEIGRDGSLFDLLFLITHGEGHPPLWSLILAIPAKIGVPYLWGLKSVAFIFSVATVALIEFFASLPKYVKHMLPFTYFIFYQYGIISRTYCVMMLVFILVAMAFKDKDIHPFRFVGTLFLLCLCSAYGIGISGGIAIAWCIDILKEYVGSGEKLTFSGIIKKDKRLSALALLLVGAIALLAEIWPYSTTSATNINRFSGFLIKFAYMAFSMPGDSLVSSTFPEQMGNIDFMEIIPGLIVTAIVVGYMFVSCRRKCIKYYVLPQLIFAVMMSYYGIYHHSGIAFLLILFTFLIGYDEEIRKESIGRMVKKLPQLEPKRISIGFRGAVALILGIMVVYSVLSAKADILLPYCESMEIAGFIKDHEMEDASIMVEWDMKKNVKYGVAQQPGYEPKVKDFDTNATLSAVSVLPYFDKNIFFNHNSNNGFVGYTTHFVATDEENSKAYADWKAHGTPEILLGTPKLDLVYDDVSYEDYRMVLKAPSNIIWKGGTGPNYTELYVRKDCLNKYGLE